MDPLVIVLSLVSMIFIYAFIASSCDTPHEHEDE